MVTSPYKKFYSHDKELAIILYIFAIIELKYISKKLSWNLTAVWYKYYINSNWLVVTMGIGSHNGKVIL